MIYNKADLEFLMSFSSLGESHIDTIAKTFSKFGLTSIDCWVLDANQELQTIETVDPVKAYVQSLSLEPKSFMFAAKGVYKGDEIELIAAFNFDYAVISLTMGNQCLLQVGENTPTERISFFFNVAREAANLLKPLYGFIGPETYSTQDLALAQVESTGISRFSSAMLDIESFARVSDSYGLA